MSFLLLYVPYTRSVTGGTSLPTEKDHMDYNSLHLGLYPNIHSLPSPPPLSSTANFYIPHHMQQPHLLHLVNPPCHSFCPFPLHHPPSFSYGSEFTSSQITPYQLSHLTPSSLPPSPVTPTPIPFVDFPVIASSTQLSQCLPHSSLVSSAAAIALHSFPSFDSLTDTECHSSSIVGEASGYILLLTTLLFPNPPPPPSPPLPSTPPLSLSLFSSASSQQTLLQLVFIYTIIIQGYIKIILIAWNISFSWCIEHCH